MVVEAERQLTMNNERQTMLVRGLVRPGDVTSEWHGAVESGGKSRTRTQRQRRA